MAGVQLATPLFDKGREEVRKTEGEGEETRKRRTGGRVRGAAVPWPIIMCWVMFVLLGRS